MVSFLRFPFDTVEKLVLTLGIEADDGAAVFCAPFQPNVRLAWTDAGYDVGNFTLGKQASRFFTSRLIVSPLTARVSHPQQS